MRTAVQSFSKGQGQEDIMYVNTDFLGEVVDWLNKKNIKSPDSNLENPWVGTDDLNYIWKLLLEFGLDDDRLANYEESIWPPKLKKGKVCEWCALNNITR